MANIPKVSVESNFTGGLKTEFTGLNFPENAATDTENCIYTITGDVIRRPGFDYEANFSQTTIDRTGCAIASYKWNNAGGTGSTQFVVEQIGVILYFYKSSAATIAAPLSTRVLAATVTISAFLPSGSSNDPKGVECQFSDGNGYLFVYHPYCDPFYCIYDPTADSVASFLIDVQIRDFAGIPETGVPVLFRPTALTNEHNYNLQNQGWTSAPSWTATSNNVTYTVTSSPGAVFLSTGSHSFTVAAGLTISGGTQVSWSSSAVWPGQNTADGSFGVWNTNGSGAGVVTSYSGTTLVVNITSSSNNLATGVNVQSVQSWQVSISSGIVNNTISTFQSAVGSYPSNADIWFSFKNSSGVFSPSTTINNVNFSNAPAPQGHFLVDAFNIKRTAVSGVSGITDVTTLVRPRTGTWFQGRVWYTGADASQVATGDQPYSTWTENIYFSQIVTDSTQFGMCYQVNDPTDENLFGILPSDGGVITIQGAGSIYKLFPIQNGMLVFAGNGIWFITGSQGIGFTANDYTITKISQVQSISCTSFVNVQGLPIFWNEEGIYTVEPAQQGLGLTVNPITVGTILSFFANIPLQSKKYVRGDYHPLDYTVKWIYRSTNETSVTDRYQYDSVLNLNTYNKAFFPYSISGTPHIHSILYVSGPGGSTSPDPTFKYVTSVANAGSYKFTFSEEYNTDYLDWHSYDNVGVDYVSYFVTGYKIHGQALRQWQPEYVHIYSTVPSYYKIQGIWNYANSGNSGKYSSIQKITNDSTTYANFNIVMRRHRIRGHGTVFQIKVLSVSGQPFDINGWAIMENINAGV